VQCHFIHAYGGGRARRFRGSPSCSRTASAGETASVGRRRPKRRRRRQRRQRLRRAAAAACSSRSPARSTSTITKATCRCSTARPSTAGTAIRSSGVEELLLREVVDGRFVGACRCVLLSAAGINFQACSIDHSDISPYSEPQFATTCEIVGTSPALKSVSRLGVRYTSCSPIARSFDQRAFLSHSCGWPMYSQCASHDISWADTHSGLPCIDRRNR